MSLADLLDVNVWVALIAPEHPFRPRAATYWRDESSPQIAFSRATSLGLLRVACNAAHFGGVPLTPAEAWGVYRAWRRRPEVRMMDEPAGCDDILDDWTRKGLTQRTTWTDAYLAAFALAGRHRIVTFDGDFKRFPGLALLHLKL